VIIQSFQCRLVPFLDVLKDSTDLVSATGRWNRSVHAALERDRLSADESRSGLHSLRVCLLAKADMGDALGGIQAALLQVRF
jgi:hypothetical protein